MKIRKTITLIILVLSLVFASTSFAFALPEYDDYLISGSSFNWSGASGNHSIGSNDKIGNILAKFYNGISLDLKAVDVHINDIYTRLSPVQYLSTLNDLKSGWGTLGNWTVPNGYGDSWYNVVLSHYRNFADEFRTTNQFQSQQTGLLQNVYTTLLNGVSINTSNSAIQQITDGIENIVSNTAIWKTPTVYPFTYSYRTAINSNPVFYSSNSNGLNIGIRADETTGALKFATQNITNQADFLSLMHNDLMQLSMRMQTMGATYNPVVYDPDGNSYSYNAQSIMDALVTYGNNHGSMFNDIRTGLNGFRDDINIINWRSYSNPVVTYSKSYHGTNISSESTSNTWFVNIRGPRTSMLKIEIPLFVGSNNQLTGISASIVNGNNSTYKEIADSCIVYASEKRGYTTFFIIVPEEFYWSENYDIIIKCESATFVNPANQAYLSYLNVDDSDYYHVQDFIYNFNINKLFEQAKEMYFDDESLQAKKNNAGQATEVLTSFTGNGAGSASVSDFAGAKDSVSAVKSGISTGTNVSNVLGIFNSNDGYTWFSTTVENDLDRTGGSNTRSNALRSSGSATPLLDEKMNALYSVMVFGND